MKVFVTSDIHGRVNVFHKVVSFIKDRDDIECLIICGDITAFHKCNTFKEIEEKQYKDFEQMKSLLQYVNKDLLFVLGNNDMFDAEKSDNSYVPYCYKEKYKNFKGIEYTDLLFQDPREFDDEDSIIKKFDLLKIDSNSIVISHVPPYKCLDNINNGLNFGSLAIKELIRDKKPSILFCGHVHHAFGVKKLYDTLVFNCACDENESRGWIVDIEKLSYEKIVL